MKFYLRYADQQVQFTQSNDTALSNNSTEVFYCNKLTQEEGAWNNGYIYVISTDANINGLERRISNFNADKDALYVEWPCDTDQVPTTDDNFELVDIWPPVQIHDAINDAIRDSWRTYPDLVLDETLVIEDNKRAYDLSALAQPPSRMMQVYVERSSNAVGGQVTTVTTSDVFGDTTIDLSTLTADSSVITDWKLSIHDGTGKGQLYSLTAASTTTQLVTGTSTSASATNPDTTSKITIWNPAEHDNNWYRFLPVRFDASEFPNTMYMQEDLSGNEGMRIRLIYLAQHQDLSADSDLTTVPKYYVINKALSILHDSLVSDNRADRRDHSGIAEHYDQLARAWAAQNPRRLPAGSVWIEPDAHSAYNGGNSINPLGW
jgi:hypothetical protein